MPAAVGLPDISERAGLVLGRLHPLVVALNGDLRPTRTAGCGVVVRADTARQTQASRAPRVAPLALRHTTVRFGGRPALQVRQAGVDRRWAVACVGGSGGGARRGCRAGVRVVSRGRAVRAAGVGGREVAAVVTRR